MGDPKFTKKKFSAPPHPWQKSRIDEEKELTREYGLKNKKELWRMGALIKNFANQAKSVTARRTEQTKKEGEQLLVKLFKLNLLPKGSSIDDVLSLTIKDILERRLQTIVFKKGLARSINQARQFITHRHVVVEGRLVTSPSFIVSAAGESQMAFLERSALADAEHPERSTVKQVQRPQKEEKEDKKEKVEGKKEEPKSEVKEKKEEKPAEPKKEEKEDKKEKVEGKKEDKEEKSEEKKE